MSKSAAELSRSVRVEAVDLNGESLSDATFKVFVNSKLLASKTTNRGIVELQLAGPVTKLEVDIRYKGDMRKSRIADSAKVEQVAFDSNRWPPPKPDAPQIVPAQGA